MTHTFLGDDAVTRGRQSWKRQATVDIDGVKVRVVIERDSYDFQSRIYSEVFNKQDLKWNRLESRSGTEYGHLPSYVVTDDVAIVTATNELLLEMVAYAEEVLA